MTRVTTASSTLRAAPRRRKILVLSALAAVVLVTYYWRPLMFVGGGGMVSVGHVMQELVSGWRFDDGSEATPQQVLAGILDANGQASWLRDQIPGQVRKPEALLVMCIDPRLDARVVVGDTRDYYDVLRIPGSVLSEETIEAIELGVKEHRVKVVLFTRHTDCAMEKVAGTAEAHHFPALSEAVSERDAMFQQLLARPIIAERIASGELIVRCFTIDTETDRLMPA